MPACPDGHESSATDFCDVCGMRIGGQAPVAGSSPAPAPGQVSAQGPAKAGSSSIAQMCPQCGTDRNGQFCEVCGFDFTSGAPARPTAQPPAPPGPTTQPPAPPGPTTQLPAPPGPTTQPPAPPGPAEAGTDPSGSGPEAASAGASRLEAGARPAAGAASAAGAEPAASMRPAWVAVVTADRSYFDSVVAAGGPDAGSMEFPQYCPERRFQLSAKEIRIGRRSASRGLEPEIDLTGPPTDPGISHLHAVLIAQPDGTWSVLDPGSSNGTQVNGGDIAVGVAVALHDGDRVCVGAWTVLTILAID
jgi:hypothetical protein